ncbi:MULTISPECIES: hypothetical protein [unclassified Geobacillus]|uniref:hypothetical protein n=1 Tax=unclassified Geobacillus TaxID=2642459 RepID=UPI000D3BB3BC|nr:MULTISPECIES: hypothetical protein [unclassified Geobacillus]PUF85758.1 hypothetical protein DCC82_15450 [Geobacillus sp. LYN3]TXK89072.1 hypothetical protein FVE68_01665 [Geobacillus sp. AYS3]
MDFFAEESERKENNDTAYEQPERLDLELLAIGKRTGLSFSEMNELRVRDLLAYADIYIGDKKQKTRMATQEDIDRFFG